MAQLIGRRLPAAVLFSLVRALVLGTGARLGCQRHTSRAAGTLSLAASNSRYSRERALPPRHGLVVYLGPSSPMPRVTPPFSETPSSVRLSRDHVPRSGGHSIACTSSRSLAPHWVVERSCQHVTSSEVDAPRRCEEPINKDARNPSTSTSWRKKAERVPADKKSGGHANVDETENGKGPAYRRGGSKS